MPNPVTVSHVEARFFRSLSEQEYVNVKAWLADAWALVLAHRPSLEANLAADPQVISTGNVIRVLSDAVIRKLQNPEGKSMESIDDYRYERSAVTADGTLYITDYELGLLTPSGTKRHRTIRLVAYGES